MAEIETLEQELARLEGEQQAADNWGAALGARHERIKGLRAAVAALRPETRDIGVIGPVDGMNQLSALGPYFRIVLTTGDNQNRSEFLISKGAAEDLRDTLAALLKAPSIFTDEFFDSFEA